MSTTHLSPKLDITPLMLLVLRTQKLLVKWLSKLKLKVSVEFKNPAVGHSQHWIPQPWC